MEFVRNWKEIAGNIRTVFRGLSSKNDDQKSYFEKLLLGGRCFVAAKLNGNVVFAPSRFIGYAANSLSAHEENKRRERRDGRITNPTIAKILGSKWIESNELEKLYKKYCKSLGLVPIDLSAKKICRKYIDARDRKI